MEGFLAGCVLSLIVFALVPHPSTTPQEIEWAEKVCASNGGLRALRAGGRFILVPKARCMNGALFYLRAGEKDQNHDR